MVYAQILNLIVVNTIILDDPTLIPLFTQGFDYLIQISSDPGSPSIAWSYDPGSNTFSPPQE
jgi:hypothetical protein